MLAGRDDDAQPGAGLDVDMRIDAALADQAQFRQPLQQGLADLRALADQHQDLGLGQAPGQPVDILQVVVPDRDLVPGELGKTPEGTQRVEIVVEDADLHGPIIGDRP
jgi:hypothetical protein